MQKTTGNFYFKLTTAGNLLGEYSNQGTPKARPECAFRDDNIPNSDRTTFAGDYSSTWFEPGEGGATATLRIVARPESGNPATRFTLTWTDGQRGMDMFQGEAMLNDGLLIGHYHSAS